jgi:predicted regulator of Ras-like GTPase activity (Roadblock/LC7/MglB family)
VVPMSFSYVVMAIVFTAMALAIVVDQRLLRPVAPRARAGDSAEARPLPADLERTLASVLAAADGWALVGPDGTLLATNLPRRAALLAAACAALRLSTPGADDAGTPDRPARMEAPGGTLLAAASADGLVLSVLLAQGRDEGAASAAMATALRLGRRADGHSPATDAMALAGSRPSSPPRP